MKTDKIVKAILKRNPESLSKSNRRAMNRAAYLIRKLPATYSNKKLFTELVTCIEELDKDMRKVFLSMFVQEMPELKKRILSGLDGDSLIRKEVISIPDSDHEQLLVEFEASILNNLTPDGLLFYCRMIKEASALFNGQDIHPMSRNANAHMYLVPTLCSIKPNDQTNYVLDMTAEYPTLNVVKEILDEIDRLAGLKTTHAAMPEYQIKMKRLISAYFLRPLQLMIYDRTGNLGEGIYIRRFPQLELSQNFDAYEKLAMCKPDKAIAVSQNYYPDAIAHYKHTMIDIAGRTTHKQATYLAQPYGDVIIRLKDILGFSSILTAADNVDGAHNSIQYSDAGKILTDMMAVRVMRNQGVTQGFTPVDDLISYPPMLERYTAQVGRDESPIIDGKRGSIVYSISDFICFLGEAKELPPPPEEEPIEEGPIR